ncbi:hypothetical protein Lal_00033686 [Lupinus albus]|nr:hypothetical protein Lal_00033686 [Lupinus albus]
MVKQAPQHPKFSNQSENKNGGVTPPIRGHNQPSQLLLGSPPSLIDLKPLFLSIELSWTHDPTSSFS